jgi:hypothetical protein
MTAHRYPQHHGPIERRRSIHRKEVMYGGVWERSRGAVHDRADLDRPRPADADGGSKKRQSATAQRKSKIVRTGLNSLAFISAALA